MDGLLVGTGIILALAFIPLRELRRVEHYVGGPGAAATLD